MSQHSYNLGSKGKWHSIAISHYRAAEKQNPSAGVWEVTSEHLEAYRLHTAKTTLLCQDTLIISFPIPLNSQAVSWMLHQGM